jgi:ribosomal protein S27AE
VVALATDQTIAVLNYFGVAGVVMLVAGIGTYLAYEGTPPLGQLKYASLAMSGTGVVAALLMFFGRPMDEAEKAFNILTIIGVVNVVVMAGLLSLYLEHFSKSLTKQKKCPECANTVLAEARKCQFCHYKFDT